MLAATVASAASPGLAAPERRVHETYLGLAAGGHAWLAYSNRDEVEADTEPGYGWRAAVGVALFESYTSPSFEASASRSFGRAISDRLGARLGVEVGQRFSAIHGINDRSVSSQRTGDGKTLQATTLHVAAWPSVRIAEGWRLYVGGGGGVTWLRGLGSDQRVGSGETGLGVLYALPVERCRLVLDIGWRSFFASSTQLRGALADFDTHGVAIGLQVSF